MAKTAEELAEAFGYLTVKEVEGIKKLVNMLPVNPVVINLGAGSGTSGLAILEARADVTLYTVDIRQNSPLGSLDSEKHALEATGVDYSNRYHPILGNSAEVGKDWDKGQVDMVFIDADHDETSVHADIEAWLPHIAPTGILAFDDYGEKRPGAHRWAGVRYAVDLHVAPHFNEIMRVDSLIAFDIV